MRLRLDTAPRSARRWAWSAAASILCAVVISLGWDDSANEGDIPRAAPNAPQLNAPPPSTAPTAAAAASTTVQPQDDVARQFELGLLGGLVLDDSARGTLEVLVANLPQPPEPADLEALARDLRSGLPAQEAERALTLLQSYRAYQADLLALETQREAPASFDQATQWFARVEALQQRYFGPEQADVLFGATNRYARITTEANFIDQDPRLSEQDKRERLSRLRAQLPPDQQSAVPEPSPAPVEAAEPPTG